MKWHRLVPLLIAICLFAGCTTLNQRDRQLLRRHDVSAPLYAKMVPMELISLPDVVELTHHRVPAQFIAYYLWATGAAYHVTEGDIRRLRRAGVGEEVIDYILANPPMYTPSSYPYYEPLPYYIQGMNTFPPPYDPTGTWKAYQKTDSTTVTTTESTSSQSAYMNK